MKALLKSIAKRLLFGSQPAKTFPAVRISPDQIIEKVFLLSDTDRIDVSERHCIICHAPFCIAVWMTPDQPENTYKKVTVVTNQSTSTEAYLSLDKQIKEGANSILIFKVLTATCYQINTLRQWLIARYL